MGSEMCIRDRIQIHGQCIANSVRVKIRVESLAISRLLDCDPVTSVFETTVDLSAAADGAVDLEYIFVTSSGGTVYTHNASLEIESAVIAPFTIPALVESPAGSVTFPALTGAVSYTIKLIQSGSSGEPALNVSVSSNTIDVSALPYGMVYNVSLAAIDKYGIEYPAENDKAVSFTRLNSAPSNLS